jgi:hypothetical protein
VLLFITGAAQAAVTLERSGHGKRRGDELHLLPPAQAETLLDAAVAIAPPWTFRQKVSDLLWNESVRHRHTRPELNSIEVGNSKFRTDVKNIRL